MLITFILLISVLFLAFSNGANDNFKGVATLYGSASGSFRTALWWASITTLAGSLLSIFFARELTITFSGASLIGDAEPASTMLAAIAAAAASTVFLATWLGMPTSTTHALTGALIGTALASRTGSIQWDTLMASFLQPLLLSPLLAITAAAAFYPFLHRLRLSAGISAQTCLCVGEQRPQPVIILPDGTAHLTTSGGTSKITVTLDESDRCVERYSGHFLGIRAQSLVDLAHWLSGGAVCFARAVNDTPKIAALLLTANLVGGGNTTVLLMVTIAVVTGGLIQARKVAHTMSLDITSLNTGQGLTANLITSLLVLGASNMGVPVSTTHVSCGAIFGISAVNGQRNWPIITGILATWITTLPLALVLGFLFHAAYNLV